MNKHCNGQPGDSVGTPAPVGGFLRLPQVLALVPVSPSTWWQGVKDGRYPQPVKLAARVTAWRADDVAALVASLSAGRVGV